MDPILISQLTEIAKASQAAAHGERQAIYAAASQQLGIAQQTLHRYLKQVTVRPVRKRRADAGLTTLTLAEAQLISGYLMAHMRKNGKFTKSIKQALQELRSNGEIVAGGVDQASGEIRYLSESAVSKALRGYNLHPEQLLTVDPVTPQKSKHPNWCWQLDASLCVYYKMPTTAGFGLEEVHTTERYKNKLSHFAKIEHRLVQRYLMTDHASGAIYIWYALGGESTESVCQLLVNAIVQRGSQPFYGIPNHLMVDRGSANRSAMFLNLCQSLGINLITTQGARAKGQVEKMHDVVEREFESGLKLLPKADTVEALNQLAERWANWFNGTKIHTRTQKTRYAAWLMIREQQLITTQLSTAELLLLAREKPLERPVTPYLTVNYKGKEWDVSKVPNVMVKQKLLITRCGLDQGFAQAVLVGDDGQPVFYQLPEKLRDEMGFYQEAAMIAEAFISHADTPAQTNRKTIERLAMGAQTDSEAAENRKAKTLPFNGTIDPFKDVNAYQAPSYIAKRGTQRAIEQAREQLIRMSMVQMAKWLSGRLGSDWQASYTAELQKRFPDGATEPELEQVLADLRAGRQASGKAKLKVV